jgi:RIO kinase 2
VGKESDIFVVAPPPSASDPKAEQRILKVHRLGRISFRTIKTNRDYLRKKSSGSWMYMSRLAALKEYTFMQALRENGFSVPRPIAQSRHTIVMELIDAFPLRQISDVPDPTSLYAELIQMVLQLAEYGLIHGDFNEFNILVKELHGAEESNPDSTLKSLQLVPVLIDFPQMLSVDHPNAEMYFDRDINCVKRFFERRFHFTSDQTGPTFAEARKALGKNKGKRLDIEVEATGFSKKMAKELEAYMKNVGVDGDGSGVSRSEEGEEETMDEEEEEEDEESVERLAEQDDLEAGTHSVLSLNLNQEPIDILETTRSIMDR